MLRCPICKEELFKKDNSFQCHNRHNFDLAKSGYLNFNFSNKAGDDKELVEARINFLKLNHYSLLKDELIKLSCNSQTLLDLACGTGYYTRDLLPTNKYGIDLSKSAIDYAAKNDKTSNYIVCSIFDTPFYDTSFDCVLTIFAPLAYKEIVRLLKPEGIFINITPGINHLYELKEKIYDKPYKNSGEIISVPSLKLIETKTLEYQVKLKSYEEIINLFNMTPYKYKTSLEDIKRLENIDQLLVTVSFDITLYQK